MRRGPDQPHGRAVLEFVRYLFAFPPHLIPSLIVGVLLLAAITWRLSAWWAQGTDGSSVGSSSASLAFVINALLVLVYLVIAIHMLRSTPRNHW